MNITLANCNVGEKFIIKTLSVGPQLMYKLFNVGILPRRVITVVRRSMLGAIVVKIDAASIAIDDNIASGVVVIPFKDKSA